MLDAVAHANNDDNNMARRWWYGRWACPHSGISLNPGKGLEGLNPPNPPLPAGEADGKVQRSLPRGGPQVLVSVVLSCGVVLERICRACVLPSAGIARQLRVLAGGKGALLLGRQASLHLAHALRLVADLLALVEWRGTSKELPCRHPSGCPPGCQGPCLLQEDEGQMREVVM